MQHLSTQTHGLNLIVFIFVFFYVRLSFLSTNYCTIQHLSYDRLYQFSVLFMVIVIVSIVLLSGPRQYSILRVPGFLEVA
jgi:hypothetical protein